MRTSLNELLPMVRVKALTLQALCKEKGIDIIFTATYRSSEEQDKLYSQPFDHVDNDRDGRIDEGDEKVTLAKGGQSYHNHRVAFDIVPLVHGKAIWNNMQLWSKIGKIGQAIGLEWGGSWEQFPDVPHFQYTLGYTWMQFLDGTADLQKFNIQTTNMENQIGVGELPKTIVRMYEIVDKNTKEVFLVNKLGSGDEDHDGDMDFIAHKEDGTEVIFSNPGYENEQYVVRDRETKMAPDGATMVLI